MKNVTCPKSCLPYQPENSAPVPCDAKHLWIVMVAIWMAEFYENDESAHHRVSLKSLFKERMVKLKDRISFEASEICAHICQHIGFLTCKHGGG